LIESKKNLNITSIRYFFPGRSYLLPQPARARRAAKACAGSWRVTREGERVSRSFREAAATTMRGMGRGRWYTSLRSTVPKIKCESQTWTRPTSASSSSRSVHHHLRRVHLLTTCRSSPSYTVHAHHLIVPRPHSLRYTVIRGLLHPARMMGAQYCGE